MVSCDIILLSGIFDHKVKFWCLTEGTSKQSMAIIGKGLLLKKSMTLKKNLKNLFLFQYHITSIFLF